MEGAPVFGMGPLPVAMVPAPWAWSPLPPGLDEPDEEEPGPASAGEAVGDAAGGAGAAAGAVALVPST